MERMAEEEDSSFAPLPQTSKAASGIEVRVTDRADTERVAKTTLPKIAGSYKLPPSSLLHRPDEQQSVNEDELKVLAQVLTAKYAEFDVHGQVTQINPGPVVTTFEFKPEAGIKYTRITGLTDDFSLPLPSQRILTDPIPPQPTPALPL